MRNFFIHPDDGGGLDVSARKGPDVTPDPAFKPSAWLKHVHKIKNLKKEDFLIIILAFLSAAVAAILILT